MSFGTYMKGAMEVAQVFYTAKSIHATDGSRVAVQADLAVGDIVTMDPFDHEGNGVGNTVGSVLNAATYLALKSYIVVGFHPDVNKVIDSATGQRQGGVIEVAVRASCVAARCVGGTDLVPGVTGVCLKESSGVTVKPHLEAAAAPTTVAIAAKTQGLALEAYTDTDVVLKNFAWGGYAGSAGL
jgi:hypothetical protein